MLQHHIQALDQVLCNMADVVDMTDELDDALLQSDKPSALQTAERLCRVVAGEPFEVAGTRLWMTVSVGVAAR